MFWESLEGSKTQREALRCNGRYWRHKQCGPLGNTGRYWGALGHTGRGQWDTVGGTVDHGTHREAAGDTAEQRDGLGGTRAAAG